MYGGVELTANEQEGVADVVLRRGPRRPERQDILKLLGEAEEARDGALDLGFGPGRVRGGEGRNGGGRGGGHSAGGVRRGRAASSLRGG